MDLLNHMLWLFTVCPQHGLSPLSYYERLSFGKAEKMKTLQTNIFTSVSKASVPFRRTAKYCKICYLSGAVSSPSLVRMGMFVLCESVLLCWLRLLLIHNMLFYPDKAKWWKLRLYPGRKKPSPHHQICGERLHGWGQTCRRDITALHTHPRLVKIQCQTE